MAWDWEYANWKQCFQITNVTYYKLKVYNINNSAISNAETGGGGLGSGGTSAPPDVIYFFLVGRRPPLRFEAKNVPNLIKKMFLISILYVPLFQVI